MAHFGGGFWPFWLGPGPGEDQDLAESWPGFDQEITSSSPSGNQFGRGWRTTMGFGALLGRPWEGPTSGRRSPPEASKFNHFLWSNLVIFREFRGPRDSRKGLREGFERLSKGLIWNFGQIDYLGGRPDPDPFQNQGQGDFWKSAQKSGDFCRFWPKIESIFWSKSADFWRFVKNRPGSWSFWPGPANGLLLPSDNQFDQPLRKG